MNLGTIAEAILVVAFVASLWPRPQARMVQRYLAPVLGALAVSGLSTLTYLLPLPWSTVLTGVAMAALSFQPYLLLRLVSVLQPVSRWLMTAIGLVTAVLILLDLSMPFLAPRAGRLAETALVFLLICIEAYGAKRLAAAAVKSVGATRHRAALLSAASWGVTGVLLLVAARVIAHVHVGTTLTGAVSATLALAYLTAAAPPRWLRHAWEMPVLYRFYQRLNSADIQTETALENELIRLAIKIVGGVAGGVLWRDPDRPRYHRDVAVGLSVETPDGDPLTFDVAADDLLEEAWHEGASRIAQVDRASLSRVAGPGITNLRAIRRVVIVPVQAGGETQCVMRLFTPVHGLFLQDDSDLLAALGTYTGARIQSARTLSRELDMSRRLREANRDLRAASLAKSDFLSGMSHELRTPLNAIIGFSDLLLERRAGALTDRQERYTANILESGQHLLQIVNDVLDIAKADAARLDIRPAAVRLSRVVQGALLLVGPQAGSGGVALHDEVPPDAFIWADELRARQVLVNLLSNAVKFTSVGGRVAVRAEPRDAVIEVSVADTGIGIDAADLAGIFDEFTQVSQGTDRTYEGTGLGLPLVRRLMQAMGGGVRAESSPGFGSVFTVWFPKAHEPPAADRLPASSTGLPSGRIPVLVIDDDRLVRELSVHTLADAGYEVRTAATLAAAREAMELQAPRVIVLDIILDGESGDGLFASLEEMRPRPRVVVMTILDRGRHTVPGEVDAWLVKPVRPEELSRAVTRVLSDEAGEEVASRG